MALRPLNPKPLFVSAPQFLLAAMVNSNRGHQFKLCSNFRRRFRLGVFYTPSNTSAGKFQKPHSTEAYRAPIRGHLRANRHTVPRRKLTTKYIATTTHRTIPYSDSWDRGRLRSPPSTPSGRERGSLMAADGIGRQSSASEGRGESLASITLLVRNY